MRLLAHQHQRQLEDHLARRLDELFADATCDLLDDGPAAPDAGLGAFAAPVKAYVLAGGKRVRPQLCAWTYLAAADRDTLGDAALDLAVGWELFHAFLLAHDDIIDAATARRDRPALHVELAALDHGQPHVGLGLGIVAGDLLYAGAVRLWHAAPAPAAARPGLARLFARVATLTGFGQAIDILAAQRPADDVGEATLLREYAWKTAAYTFEGPMLSGALLAGLDAPAQRALSRYALALGQAYQLQNDLLDFARPCDDGHDLVQGKRTIALLRHRAGLTAEARARLDACIAEIAQANGRAVACAEKLRAELLACDAAAPTRALVAELLADAERASGDSALPERLSGALGAMLSALRASYFV